MTAKVSKFCGQVYCGKENQDAEIKDPRSVTLIVSYLNKTRKFKDKNLLNLI